MEVIDGPPTIAAEAVTALLEKLLAARTAKPAAYAAALPQVEAVVLEHGTAEQIVRLYVARRDDKADLKKAFDKDVAGADAFLASAEGRLRVILNEQGLNSLATDSGTAFKKKATYVSVSDRAAFKDFVEQEPENWAFLDIKANKTAVAEYVESNKGAVPPGVNWREEEEIYVRR